MQPSFLPATILLFLLSFLFLVFNWFIVFTGEILISACTNYLCWECLPSLLPVSSPKRCKLAETTCISQNCNEICLKTPKSGRNARVFAKYMQKLTKALNSNWKTRFCFCFCKIQLMSRSKTRYFQQNRDTIYVKTHNPAKTQCSQ